MKRVFHFLAKGTVPLRAMPSPKPVQVPTEEADAENDNEHPLERQVRDLLWRFELAEAEEVRLRKDNADLFDKLDRLALEKEEVKEILRRLLHTKSGPPEQVRPGASSHVWARGETRMVEVTYKRKSGYYDPMLLPKSVFTMIPGVVTGVDKSKLDRLAKTDKRIAGAFKHGDWMTPAVSIPRMKTDMDMQMDAGTRGSPHGEPDE